MVGMGMVGTIMDIRTMHTATETAAADGAMLQLLWLASPALPIGGFSYSEGLEAAVDSGRVQSEAQARSCLRNQLQLSLARSDLPAVALAIRAWRSTHPDRIASLNAWILQTRETSELRLQTEQMGRSLLEWLRNHTTASPAAIALLAALNPSYPIAYALAASATAASVRNCLLAYAFGWAENMTQAAIKSVPLGQRSAQRILSALVADIPQAVDHALALDAEALQAFSPMLAILSSQHENQYSRLFRS